MRWCAPVCAGTTGCGSAGLPLAGAQQFTYIDKPSARFIVLSLYVLACAVCCCWHRWLSGCWSSTCWCVAVLNAVVAAVQCAVFEVGDPEPAACRTRCTGNVGGCTIMAFLDPLHLVREAGLLFSKFVYTACACCRLGVCWSARSHFLQAGRQQPWMHTRCSSSESSRNSSKMSSKTTGVITAAAAAVHREGGKQQQQLVLLASLQQLLLGCPVRWQAQAARANRPRWVGLGS